jgi:membrane protein implicated in regulation of membrane protease activity
MILKMKGNRIELAVNIVMWVIAGIIALLGLFLGIAAAYSLFGTSDYIAGLVICGGLILFGLFLSFVFISFFKFISNMLFYSSMADDYKTRKKGGKPDDKY